jgi:hypothetical protein
MPLLLAAADGYCDVDCPCPDEFWRFAGYPQYAEPRAAGLAQRSRLSAHRKVLLYPAYSSREIYSYCAIWPLGLWSTISSLLASQ